MRGGGCLLTLDLPKRAFCDLAHYGVLAEPVGGEFGVIVGHDGRRRLRGVGPRVLVHGNPCTSPMMKYKVRYALRWIERLGVTYCFRLPW